MVAITKFVTIKCKKSKLNQIEQYVEDISKNLFINETYFGNILTSLNLLFNYLTEHKACTFLRIYYTTNYKTVKLNISGLDENTVNQLLRKADITETENNEDVKNIFLIQSLTDGIRFSKSDSELILTYDISAVHDQIFNERKYLLETYFKKEPNKEAATNQ